MAQINARTVQPWQRRRGPPLPLTAEGCSAQGLIRAKAAKVFSAVFSLVAAAGEGWVGTVLTQDLQGTQVG